MFVSVAISRGEVRFPLFSALSAMPAFAVGAWLADTVWAVVSDPQRRPVLAFVIGAGICAPAVTGAFDLYLSARTP